VAGTLPVGTPAATGAPALLTAEAALTAATARATAAATGPAGGATRGQQRVQTRLRDRLLGRHPAPGGLDHRAVLRRHDDRLGVHAGGVEQPGDGALLVRQGQGHHHALLPRTRGAAGAV